MMLRIIPIITKLPSNAKFVDVIALTDLDKRHGWSSVDDLPRAYRSIEHSQSLALAAAQGGGPRPPQ